MRRPFWNLALFASLLAAVGCKTQRGAERTPEPTTTEPVAETEDTSTVAEDGAPVREAFQCDEPAAAPWPMFQRDPARTGRTGVEPVESPGVKWSVEVGIASWLNSPIVAHGHVFAASSGQVWNKPDGGDGVFAFTLDGKRAWFHELPGDANGIAYEECRIFVTSDAGLVAALDARTGEPLWEREFDQGKVYSNPLPLDGRVVVGTAFGELYALDQETGDTVWSKRVRGAIRGGVASDGEVIYVATEQAQVAALDAESGTSIWAVDVDLQELYPAPTVTESAVVLGHAVNVSQYDPSIFAMEKASGEMKWMGDNPRNLGGGFASVRSSPAYVNGALVWGEAYSNRIVAADAQNGEVVRSTPAGACTFPHYPSPAVAGQTVYLPRHDGGLYAVDAETGALQWSLYLGDSTLPAAPFPEPLRREFWDDCEWKPPVGTSIYASPAVGQDGTIFVATGEGWLYAIGDTGEGSASTASTTQAEQGEKSQ